MAACGAMLAGPDGGLRVGGCRLGQVLHSGSSLQWTTTRGAEVRWDTSYRATTRPYLASSVSTRLGYT